MALPKIINAKKVEIPEIKPVEKEVIKGTVKVAHMRDGLDLMGSVTTLNTRNGEIYELKDGLLIVSKKTKRKIVIPFSNIKGYELL